MGRNGFRQIWRASKLAREQGGLPIPLQMAEMLCLRLRRHALSPSEYFNHRLFRRELSFAEKAEYVGGWARDRLYRIQDTAQRNLANDKIATARLLIEANLPVPDLLAHTDPKQEIEGAAQLLSSEQLAHWLREDAIYPHFAKPSISYLGYGAFLIERYDSGSDSLVFRSGTSMSVVAFAKKYGSPVTGGGMMFQRLMRPHSSLRTVIGDRLGTARTVVLNGQAGPEVFACGFRIPVGNSMTDNFRYGEAGNMLARINISDGSVRDVIAATGLDFRLAVSHPDVGAPFDNMQLPDWNEAVRIVQAGARVFSGLPIQGWDVAFTEEGPRLVEVNSTGAVQLLQMCLGRGLAQPELLKLYQNYGGRI